MRILLVADEPCKSYWDYYDESKLKGIDLILSAGDLPPEYLSFLVTFANCPLLYVHGNHDAKYQEKPPEGCINIDDDPGTGWKSAIRIWRISVYREGDAEEGEESPLSDHEKARD